MRPTTRNLDRRKFLRDTICAALGGASLYSALGSLQLLQAATRASYGFTGYKALVCVFLYGGNDGFNMIVPISGGARNDLYLAPSNRARSASTCSRPLSKGSTSAPASASGSTRSSAASRS